VAGPRCVSGSSWRGSFEDDEPDDGSHRQGNDGDEHDYGPDRRHATGLLDDLFGRRARPAQVALLSVVHLPVMVTVAVHLRSFHTFLPISPRGSVVIVLPYLHRSSIRRMRVRRSTVKLTGGCTSGVPHGGDEHRKHSHE